MNHILIICASCGQRQLCTVSRSFIRSRAFSSYQLYNRLHRLYKPPLLRSSSCVTRARSSVGGSAATADKHEEKDNEEDEGIVQEMHTPLPTMKFTESDVRLKPHPPSTATIDSIPVDNRSPTTDNKGEELVTEDEWRDQRVEWTKIPSMYLRLSKYRLSALVVLTALAGYTMAPGTLSTSTLLLSCVGTALCSASANTFNQWIEVPFDSQMARTRNRVLVRSQISPAHAVTFGTLCGITGSSILYLCVNPLTAALGALNIFLYTSIYTPLKRISIVNTWVGSVVGAVPPLMGWAACTGGLSTGALIMSGILYSWQFPHFNALSWGLRADYSRGGYRMMSVTNPDLCRRVALRHCIGLISMCTLAPVAGLTTWWFALDSLPLNLWFGYLAWRFYTESDFKSARKLFHFSLFHLPLVMILLILNKKDWK